MVNSIESAEPRMPNHVRMEGLSKSELLAALRENGIQLNQAAEDLFADHHFEPSKEALVIRITALSVSSLGFPEGANYAQLSARAQELGVMECPLELGPYLRLQFLNQARAPVELPPAEAGSPSGAITIASSPLGTTAETPQGFYLRRVGGASWLRGYWADALHVFRPEDVFVFALEGGGLGSE